MANNRFFDDTQIIKKNDNQPLPNNQPQNNTIPQPIPEPIKPIVINDNKNISKKTNDKKQAYLDIINQFESQNKEEPKDNKIDNKPQEDNKPIYNFNRDQTGKIIIQPKNDLTPVEPGEKKSKDPTKDLIYIFLDKVKQEISRLELEVKIHIILVNNEIDSAKRSLYQTKLSSFQSDLEYNRKKESILETML